MSGQLGPMEIRCDAPPYSVVRASAGLRFQSPLDVPWYHRARFRASHDGGTGDFTVPGWKQFVHLGQQGRTTCRCGQPLPVLEEYRFRFASAREARYLLGQCVRCRAMFWQEA